MALYVTDTHPLVWYTTGHLAKLSKKAARIFEDVIAGRALVYVPAPVLWEIVLLAKRQRIRIHEEFGPWAEMLLGQPGFEFAPLDLQVIALAGTFGFTRDPFDSAIVATAKLRDLPLITRDEEITAAGVVEIAW